MARSSRCLVERLEPIGLAELDAATALQDRIDRKYLLTPGQLPALLDRIAGSHRILEIGGLRSFRYLTTYYDTPDLLTYREHLQGRRRRFKFRRRRYLDTDRSSLEVKLKGRRGRTIKHALPYSGRDELDRTAVAWLHTQVREAYDREIHAPLAPTLTIACHRLTLAEPTRGERLSCDIELGFHGAALAPGHAIVETKSARGNTLADRVLRELVIRPVPRCSKYLIGLALTRHDTHANHLLPLLRRHFTAGTPPRSASRAA